MAILALQSCNIQGKKLNTNLDLWWGDSYNCVLPGLSSGLVQYTKQCTAQITRQCTAQYTAQWTKHNTSHNALLSALYQCPIPQTRPSWEHWEMLNKGRSPEFNISSVLSKAWFGVWDTDIIPQPVFSINLSSEVTRWTLRQNQCTIDTLQSQR